MKKKFAAVAIALSICILFLMMVLTPPSVFNLLPYSIHRSLSPAGFREKEFIIVFDVLTALGIFFVIYKMGMKMMK
ncbi:hypothetical protein EGT74_14710 [Chitinophaga lutea]|uniref:Uncharacterized protein n=1 Tax=Chitinophaga lutea TaxID=2488634 RepID=A0A3N4PW41_9BACT|nr:hypothetical protein [Chitinophaga lutea]RPE08307.1 hypothetical protein EGT74_14710 [Chitinophaga lutea]